MNIHDLFYMLFLSLLRLPNIYHRWAYLLVFFFTLLSVICHMQFCYKCIGQASWQFSEGHLQRSDRVGEVIQGGPGRLSTWPIPLSEKSILAWRFLRRFPDFFRLPFRKGESECGSTCRVVFSPDFSFMAFNDLFTY